MLFDPVFVPLLLITKKLLGHHFPERNTHQFLTGGGLQPVSNPQRKNRIAMN